MAQDLHATQGMLAMRESTNLDLLRAVAVSFVVGDHLAMFMGVPRPRFLDYTALGLLGVLFFFVHTCLVLMFSLERQVARQGTERLWRRFVLRRAFRLYPLAVVVVLFLYFAGIPGLGPLEGAYYSREAGPFALVSSLLLIQNVTGTVPILEVLWTLPWEMQMYLFLPLLFLLTRRLSVRAFLALWAFSVIAAVAQFLWMGKENLLRYLPCFLSGVIAYRMNLSRPHQASSLWLVAFLVAAPILFMLAHTLGRGDVFRGMPVCLALGWLLPRVREVQNVWVRSVSRFVARYSYGIYLVHGAGIWLGFQVLDGAPWPVQWLVFLGTTLGISTLLYHCIETPMIAVGNRLSGHGPRPVRPSTDPLPEPAPAP